jgi:hypothetical protein
METTSAAAVGVGIVGVLVMVVLFAIGIVSLVCWIMTLIRIFKDNVGLGILGVVCALFAFIYGWVKVEQYQNKKTMIIWTIAVIFSVLLNVVAAVLGFGFGSMAAARSGSAG